LREIVDITQGIEWKKEFPFTSNTPYLTCGDGYGSPSGSVGIYCTNALKAPDTVSSSIQVIVEIACAKGFEFARLDPYPLGTWVPFDTTPPAAKAGKKKEIVVTAQMESDLFDHSPMIGGVGVPSALTLDPSKFCIGERFMSLRQLGTIMTRMGFLIQGNSGTQGYDMQMRPWTVGFAFDNVTDVVPPAIGEDFFGLIAACFRFMRGGVRVGFYSSNGTCLQAYQGFAVNPAYASYGSADPRPSFRGVTPLKMTQNQYLQWDVYQMTATPMWMIRPIQCELEDEPIGDFECNPVSIYIATPDLSQPTSLIYAKRGMTETSQFSFWLGVPPLIIPGPYELGRPKLKTSQDPGKDLPFPHRVLSGSVTGLPKGKEPVDVEQSASRRAPGVRISETRGAAPSPPYIPKGKGSGSDNKPDREGGPW
jgi:hypothetical protein